VDAAALRSEFPVCERVAYLNTGSMGPAPRAMVEAMSAELERFAVEGRSTNYFDRMTETQTELRERYAAMLGADATEVALQTSTSEGVVRVLAGLDLQPGDEVVTSDEEHPGVLGPLGAARRRRGIEVRVVPFAELANAVGPRTRLVACSHVSWLSGSVAPRELAHVDVPVLLDGAQGVGAVPTDVRSLGCAFYAGSGQKWMCGPVGTGMLWVSPEWRERLASFAPTYVNVSDPTQALEGPPWEDGRAYDTFELSVEATVGAIASHDVLASYGWDEVHARARDLAAAFADELRTQGREVLPRGETTLVAWRSDDPENEIERLREAGVRAREIPGRGVGRASVGAWNDESDLERLLGALGS
jgi:selenocysteine lyase/cysteine desulfurase